MRDALKEKVIKAVVPSVYLDDDTIYHLQPSGRFVIGGPQVFDSGGGGDGNGFGCSFLDVYLVRFLNRVTLV